MTNYTETDHMELWEERAAVREFDGEMTRREAEEAAYYDWRNMVGPGVEAPQAMRNAVRKFKQMKWNR